MTIISGVVDKGKIWVEQVVIFLWPFGNAEKGLVCLCRKNPKRATKIGERCLTGGAMTVMISVIFLQKAASIVVLDKELSMYGALICGSILFVSGIALLLVSLMALRLSHAGMRQDFIVWVASQGTRRRANQIVELAAAENNEVLCQAISQMPIEASREISKKLISRMITSTNRDVRIAAIRMTGRTRMRILGEAQV